MKIFSRVHLYPHSQPQGHAYIVGDPAGLRALGELLKTAATSMVGLESAEFFGSDGHSYELRVISQVSDLEWQQLALPGIDLQGAEKLDTVQTFNELLHKNKREI